MIKGEPMKCPNCGNEMEKGYIQSRDGLGWNRRKRLLSSLSSIMADQYLGTVVPAYRCNSCRKIVIDYSDSVSTSWGHLPDEKKKE